MTTHLAGADLAAEIGQIVTTVFATMLGMDAAPAEQEWKSGTEKVTATVHLGGEWNGAIVLETSRKQACRLTARMLGGEPVEMVDNDVRDAMGELANMIGGNLKTVLCPTGTLSLPMVIDGSDYSFRVVHGSSIDRHAFASEEGFFWVTSVTMPALSSHR